MKGPLRSQSLSRPPANQKQKNYFIIFHRLGQPGVFCPTDGSVSCHRTVIAPHFLKLSAFYRRASGACRLLPVWEARYLSPFPSGRRSWVRSEIGEARKERSHGEHRELHGDHHPAARDARARPLLGKRSWRPYGLPSGAAAPFPGTAIRLFWVGTKRTPSAAAEVIGTDFQRVRARTFNCRAASSTQRTFASVPT